MESLVSDIPAEDGKISNLFYSVTGRGDERERGEGAGSVKVEGCGWREKREE
jgi:hypothetical protein